MTRKSSHTPVKKCFDKLKKIEFNPLDLYSFNNLEEKTMSLVLQGNPSVPKEAAAALVELSQAISKVDTDQVRVVVFGGGTGLANVIGGDSRHPDWPLMPFNGLKEIFPRTHAVVCITDDGGSTGELLKDLPIIALGDLRHVLLASIQKKKLIARYSLSDYQVLEVVQLLYSLFNYRFEQRPESIEALQHATGVDPNLLPGPMRSELTGLIGRLFSAGKLSKLLARPHCLGNLLLAAAINGLDENGDAYAPQAVLDGVNKLGDLLGAEPAAVLPIATTPANLKILYSNGVLVTGEHKSGYAQRGYPVERVFVEFAYPPEVPKEVYELIRGADIIVFAPGSLYTSIIPMLQVPGIAAAIRGNKNALKILISNLWVQRGETDLVWGNPKRRFYVSDVLNAYQRNIPGGVQGLFHQIMVLGLHEISGSILQNYALEGKVPIYFDRDKVQSMGFKAVEARLFSQRALDERGVVQHDPRSVAKAVKVAWSLKGILKGKPVQRLPACYPMNTPMVTRDSITPSERFRRISKRLEQIAGGLAIKDQLIDIFWNHKDIPIEHLALVQGIDLIDGKEWHRSQEWDNIFSFYDAENCRIKIKEDVVGDPVKLEIAFLIALGESLLGDYARSKAMRPIESNGERIGKVYELILRGGKNRHCYFSHKELDYFLGLARMIPSPQNPLKYTRLVNGKEGFTPPGLLMGLTYAWYLDNRLAAHIEYKMAIKRIEITDLIPEQRKMLSRRQLMIAFFREKVFRLDHPIFHEKPVTR